MTERIERDGRTFTVRNLDEDPLTSQEITLQQAIETRERTIDHRVDQLLDKPYSFSFLPKAVNSTPGVTVAEKDIAREDVASLVRSAVALAEQKPDKYVSDQ